MLWVDLSARAVLFSDMRINMKIPSLRFVTAPLVAALLVFGAACSKKDEATAEADKPAKAEAAITDADPNSPENLKYKALEALGYNLARELTLHVGLSDRELDALFEGMRQEAKGEKPPVGFQAQILSAQKLMQDRMAVYQLNLKVEGDKMAGPNIEAGKAFIAKLAETRDLKRTGTGLYYEVTREGEGDYPAATDNVKVHYEGTRIDGTVFDSSYSRNSPASFPLNRVIAGWTEGLQLVRPGGEIMLYIPSNLAYGNQAAGGVIKPGDTLVFKVELLEIVATP